MGERGPEQPSGSATGKEADLIEQHGEEREGGEKQEAGGMRATAQLFEQGRAAIGRVIAGQRDLIDGALLSVLCGGHALVEGVPGVAKTLAVKTLALFLDLEFRRVQGTPDMMPADILGTNIFSPRTGEFAFHRGPVFTQFLLADEINRMPPRTQAALLESMEERQVTADGETHRLDPLFTVFATENPLEFEGTYPLPEAQLDRFLLKLLVGYPSLEEERIVLERHHAGHGSNYAAEIAIEPVSRELLLAAQREVRAVAVEPALFLYLLAVVRRTREWPSLLLGASPRAASSLLLVAKGYAARDGRAFLLPDDIKEAAPSVLRHRLILRPEAELEGLDTDRVIAEILAATAVPR